MAKSLGYGPNGTAIGGLATLTIAPTPLNYEADFSVIDEGAGYVVYTDTTSPIDQPSTLRIAQTVRPNVYAGTSIESAAMLPSRKGSDTVVEIKEQWVETDSVDPTYYRVLPVRCAITLNYPIAAQMTPAALKHLVERTVAALFGQGDATSDDGLNALLHGVAQKY